MKKTELLNAIENMKARSAWDRGVKAYALELVDGLEVEEIPDERRNLKKLLLNGAENWSRYSWGGSSLVYDCDIAKRLCTPSEYMKTRGGERRPNSREEWLDVQARALAQASNKICIFSLN